jgi:hypothetical protein
VNEFEQVSGLHIRGWNAGRIGEAVNVVLEHKSIVNHMAGMLKSNARMFRKQANEFDALADKVEMELADGE